MSRDLVLDPDALSKREAAALKRLRDRLAELAAANTPARGKAAPRMKLLLGTGEAEECLELSPALAGAVAALLSELADGHAVQVSAVSDEITTSHAAELLNVSRPFFVKLLEQGAIPYRKVGAHRRVRSADVLAYKVQMYRKAEAALQELADQAQQLGLGYE